MGRSKAQRDISETVHDCLTYGTGIVRTDVINNQKYEEVLKWADVTDPITGMPTGRKKIIFEKQLVQKYFGVGCYRVDPYDLYPKASTDAHRFDSPDMYVFERALVYAWYLREQYEILQQQGVYGVTDEWQYIKPGGDIQDTKYLRHMVDNLYIAKDEFEKDDGGGVHQQ